MTVDVMNSLKVMIILKLGPPVNSAVIFFSREFFVRPARFIPCELSEIIAERGPDGEEDGVFGRQEQNGLICFRASGVRDIVDGSDSAWISGEYYGLRPLSHRGAGRR